MSVTGRVARPALDALVRRRVKRRLEQELRRLRSSPDIVTLAPGPEVLAHLTYDLMSADHARDIVGAAFLETGDQLCDQQKSEPPSTLTFAPVM